MKLNEIEFVKIDTEQDLSDKMLCTCFFCEKETQINNLNKQSSIKEGKLYCPFCIRHNFYQKNNIYMLSFCPIIGYYYYHFYLNTKQFWLSQIKNMIENHKITGLQNPNLSFDIESYLWFVDFDNIDTIESFNEMINSLNSAFNVFQTKKYLGKYISQDIWNKHEINLKMFYEKRERDGKFFIPIFKPTYSIGEEYLINFTSKELISQF